jgi:hypothetical protein
MTAFVIGFFLGAGVATIGIALLVGSAHRRELEQRDAWERDVRRFLRQRMAECQGSPQARAIQQLLSDEAGA